MIYVFMVVGIDISFSKIRVVAGNPRKTIHEARKIELDTDVKKYKCVKKITDRSDKHRSNIADYSGEEEPPTDHFDWHYQSEARLLFFQSEEFIGLYKALLSLLGQRVICRVKLGLSVSDFLNAELVDFFKKKLCGDFGLSNGEKTTVRDVVLEPLPRGVVSSALKHDRLAQDRKYVPGENYAYLAMHAGFDSVDFELIRKDKRKKVCLGSSVYSKRFILSTLKEMVSEGSNQIISMDVLTSALNSGSSFVTNEGFEIDIKYAKQSAVDNCGLLLSKDLIKFIRTVKDETLDYCLLAGESASLLQGVLVNIFPEITFILLSESDFYAAEGFFYDG